MRRGGAEVVIDPLVWSRLKKDADIFDKAIIRELRKGMKEIGSRAVDRVKERLRMPSPGGGGDGRSRDALISGTRLSVSFGARSAGVKITTSGARLGAGHSGFQNVYNTTMFRHPVFGKRDVFVEQQGRPYFGSAIKEVLDAEFIEDMERVLDAAIAKIPRG